MNPVPYGDELSLLVDDRDNRISIDLAIHTAPLFGIQIKDAEDIAEEMLQTIHTNWERLARDYGLSRGQIDYMRPAFLLN